MHSTYLPLSLKTVLVAAFALLFAGCSKPKETTQGASPEAKPGPEAAAATKVKLIGSGASFPAPIYDRWFKEFTKQEERVWNFVLEQLRLQGAKKKAVK